MLLCSCLYISSASAYAILAHEAIVDASWVKEIKPLLREKYPMATDSDIKVAHGYVYGGAMVADMGYLPGGSAYFSDLMHYVRSGDMVENLIKEAGNLNEYAFALGALSHYRADEFGHSIATNHTVPLVYNSLRKKYGDVVTYEDDGTSHSRVEFSYDVLQIARGNYNTQAYHDFIGFAIAKPVLERAFLKTYGESLDQLFGNFEGSVSTFRWGVKNLMPTLVRKTWKSEKDSILKRQPGMTAKKFQYKMKKREYHQEFGKGESKPGFWANFLSWAINALPKIGPLKTLKYVDPGKDGERFFIHSFDTILVCYAQDLHAVRDQNLSLNNIDFDTGKPSVIGEYSLADQTYAELLISLQKGKFQYLSPGLKESLLRYYKDPQNIPASTKYPIKCSEVEIALAALRNAPTVKEVELIGKN
ncbi:hypothetical protein RG47T_1027 [Mucilaginibacter polytrichastri]|uniref:Phospholipase C/D domain-containing protein n=2 Tax=Mucilaginibacter polytrichastri TaxID=1302689 RepID=A0A1Q5ZUY2_9SPHI|nr:hypothetical protein RG47T_1027 [Mucilaginibacter polytrichastri]SFS36213.1 Zinc dependent phospholipase C [Mucilaginibacter polytrichastri]